MVNKPQESIDNPHDMEQLQHQARQVVYTSGLIALGLTVIILFV